MTDEFLEELQSSWRGQQVAFADVHARLRRQRWRPHLALGFELTVTAVTMGVGVWFASMAVALQSLLFAMAAGVLLIAAPALAVAGWIARKDSLRWEEETPESVLTSGLRRVDASLKVIRLGRVHLGVIAAFVAALWLTELGGLISARRFLVIYTAVCAAMTAFYLPWLAWREKRLNQERAVCQRLLDDLRN
ncbi:MAG TPA: hypothetical protein VFU13_07565 [Steroidobacteraceae bacterium]|nr:hypothetical protein [Steroidobacteraceae bacterium]